MTHNPDDPNDPAEGEASGRDSGSDRKLDEDAAWRDIIAHYGDRADIEPFDADDSSVAPPAPPEPPAESSEERLRGLFRPSWNDPLESEATWEDEGHFVPPTPPPVRVTDPRRRLAWAGLFGSPIVMLAAVVLGWTFPGWLMFALAGSFAGGFVYLVATMSKRPPGDGYGDDGAVV